MSNHEKFNRLYNELKSCQPGEVSKLSIAILELYPILEKAEQKEFAESIYTWAEQYSTTKPVHFAYAKLILAFSLFYNESYDRSMPLLAETQSLFTEQDDVNGAAVCMVIQGSIYRTIGNVDLALKSSWAAHEQLIWAENFQHFLMACNINLGGIYFEMKHYDEAIPLFKKTLEMAERTEKYYWAIYALHGLGKVYLMIKNYPEALRYFEKAMIDSGKINHPLSICNSISELGNYYFSVGNYPEAQLFHKRSLALREQNQFIGGAITNCIRLGEIYIKESKTDEAIAYLEKGLKLAEQIKVKLKMYQAHLLLSEIYESKNELNKSLYHYKLFHDLREQVEIEDTARRVKNAQLIFEAEQTKKENIIIKKQKKEIESKNIELQETIDELTRARVGKKARAITLVIVIVLFIFQDFILGFALSILPQNNYLMSLIVKMAIIFSLSPINKAIETYLLSRIIKKNRKEVLV